MSIRNFAMTVVLAGSMGTTMLSAHDSKLHKGKATDGEVVSIEGSKMVVKTAKGNVNVTLNKDTKYEMDEKAVDMSHFMKGSKVSVVGTKLATGELVAEEVMMTMAKAKASAKAKAASPAEGEHKH